MMNTDDEFPDHLSRTLCCDNHFISIIVIIIIIVIIMVAVKLSVCTVL